MRLKHRLLWRRFGRDTLTGRGRFAANLALIEDHARRVDLSRGCYVECGTWRGGMSFAIMQLDTGIAEFRFFDSFAGLPPATAKDGEDAIRLQRTGRLNDNNVADYALFCAAAERVRRPGQTVAVGRGWFADTLPAAVFERPIAVLRMDGDWYDSTLCILRNLFAKVMVAGLVIVDDYYDWEGCARAVHDFLAETAAPERIRQTPRGGVAYLVKEG